MACQNVNNISFSGDVGKLEQTYFHAAVYENTFNAAELRDNMVAMVSSYLSTEGEETIRFRQIFERCQKKMGEDRAFSRLETIVKAYGLCMLMDSIRGRMLVGHAKLDKLLQANRFTQTKFFKFAFGGPNAHGGAYLEGSYNLKPGE